MRKKNKEEKKKKNTTLNQNQGEIKQVGLLDPRSRFQDHSLRIA